MKVISKNRKAFFNYEVLDRYEAGIVLTGAEIKAIRNADVNIQDSYVSFVKNQAYIINMNITNYQFSNSYQDDPLRKRKLLLHKKEILRLQHEQKTKSVVIIVLNLYLNQKQKAKLEIATARPKKLYDKRQTLKARQLKREIKDKY